MSDEQPEWTIIDTEYSIEPAHRCASSRMTWYPYYVVFRPMPECRCYNCGAPIPEDILTAVNVITTMSVKNG